MSMKITTVIVIFFLTETEMDEVLDVLGSKIRTAPTDQRVRVLDSLSKLFFVHVSMKGFMLCSF